MNESVIKVPLVDLLAQYLSIKEEVDSAVARVQERGLYVMGQEVEAFEEEWARYCGAKFCVAVSSGTDALYLSLKAREIFPWKPRAWIPTRTFIATAEAAVRAGYQLLVCDQWPRPREVGLYRSNDVLIPVHLYGRRVEYPDGRSVEFPGGFIDILHDAAQAHGAITLGEHEMGACYSFYPTKNLGAHGQAGAVVTNDPALAAKLRMMRSHGEGAVRFKHEVLSGNYRMDELQAAILRAKLPHLNAWNQRRRAIAQTYLSLLGGISELTLPPFGPSDVFHIFAVETPYRDSLAIFLKEQGIQTSVRYPYCIHQQPALQGLLEVVGDMGAAEAWARTNLSLPMYPELSDDQVEYVAGKVHEWATMMNLG